MAAGNVVFLGSDQLVVFERREDEGLIGSGDVRGFLFDHRGILLSPQSGEDVGGDDADAEENAGGGQNEDYSRCQYVCPPWTY